MTTVQAPGGSRPLRPEECTAEVRVFSAAPPMFPALFPEVFMEGFGGQGHHALSTH